MILEVARDLGDSGLEFPRCGDSCLDLLRFERRRLRHARAGAEQQCEKHCATAQTRPDVVDGSTISSNLSPGWHGSHACFLAAYRKTFASLSEGVIDTRLPIWPSCLKIVNLLRLFRSLGGRFVFTRTLVAACARTRLRHAVRILAGARPAGAIGGDRKSTRLNSSHQIISYAVFCLKKKIT